jgi:hypothetical protein
MDPTLFRIDFEVLTEVLVVIVVLAFLIERALSLLFEHRLFVNAFADRGLKEPIALLVSVAIVRYWEFDALSILFQGDRTSFAGYLITAAIIAGGSKGSMKLFQDLLKVRSSAEDVRKEVKEEAKRKAKDAVVYTR